MTTPAAHPPPFGDATDEALSALLDGELGAFAADHGTTEAEARAALDAWPGTAARLGALSRARDAAATPVPPLDEVTRRRLVGAALPAAPAPAHGTGRPRGTWLGVAAAAVVLLLVVALGWTALSDGGDDASERSQTAAGAPPVPRGELGDLGDVTDPATLRALLGDDDRSRPPSAAGSGGESGGESTVEDRAAPPSASADGSDATELPQGFSRDELDAANRALSDPGACAAQLAGERAIRFTGTGTYEGRAVVVAGLDQGGRTIAFVVPLDDCASVLTSVSR
jgi:hypothetical protein